MRGVPSGPSRSTPSERKSSDANDSSDMLQQSTVSCTFYFVPPDWVWEGGLAGPSLHTNPGRCKVMCVRTACVLVCCYGVACACAGSVLARLLCKRGIACYHLRLCSHSIARVEIAFYCLAIEDCGWIDPHCSKIRTGSSPVPST